MVKQIAPASAVKQAISAPAPAVKQTASAPAVKQAASAPVPVVKQAASAPAGPTPEQEEKMHEEEVQK